jgi:uncharacterized protein
MNRPTAEDIITILDLQPHPEGGYYRETYRADLTLPTDTLPTDYAGPRNVCTGIYYLLTPGTFSAMHRVRSDELFHFYLGDPVDLLELSPDGAGHITTLGTDLLAGHTSQHLVRAGAWQGTCLQSGSEFALMGCTVAPGFAFEDFELGDRTMLQSRWPTWSDAIALRTPNPAGD